MVFGDAGLDRPGSRISVKIHRANDDEAESQSSAKSQEKSASPDFVDSIDRSERVSGRHHCDPWYERVQNEHCWPRKSKRKNDAGLVQNLPQEAPSPGIGVPGPRQLVT